jgi:hypothetical protein
MTSTRFKISLTLAVVLGFVSLKVPHSVGWLTLIISVALLAYAFVQLRMTKNA